MARALLLVICNGDEDDEASDANPADVVEPQLSRARGDGAEVQRSIEEMTTRLIDGMRRCVHQLTGAAADYDPLLERVGEARFVVLGEASHSTHEFYRERAELTTQLITEKAFTAVAVEADWPDAHHVTRYMRGVGDGQSAVDALAGFKRFPTWMWRNVDILRFLKWLHAHNDALSSNA
jgi:erythromycin esterase-like protein